MSESPLLRLVTNKPTFKRRTFDQYLIGGAIGAWFVLSLSDRAHPMIYRGDRVTRRGLEWSHERSAVFGQEMYEEQDFPTIKNAGALLWLNQQGSHTSFSEVGPMFTDNPVQIISIPGTPNELATQEKIVTKTKNSGDPLEVALQPNDPIITAKVVSQPLRKGFDQIVFSEQIQLKGSDFALRYLMSTALQYPWGRQRIGQYIDKFMIDSMVKGFKAPVEASSRQALIQYVIDNYNWAGMSFDQLAWGFAHFSTMPDFLKAKDQGKFTQADIQFLTTHNKIASILKGSGMLQKAGSEYTWDQDQNDLDDTWLTIMLAPSIFKDIIPGSKRDTV